MYMLFFLWKVNLIIHYLDVDTEEQCFEGNFLLLLWIR